MHTMRHQRKRPFQQNRFVLLVVVLAGSALVVYRSTTQWDNNNNRFLFRFNELVPPVTDSVYYHDCHNNNQETSTSQPAELFQLVRTKTVSPFEMSVYPQVEDRWVSGAIQESGCWECDLVKLVTDTLEQFQDAYFVDIGGNIGMFSLSVAAMKRTAFVLEPLKMNYNHICRSVTKNQFHDNLHLFSVAATRNDSKVVLSLLPTNKGGTSSSVVPDDQLADNLQEGVHYATGVPIDSLRRYFPTNRPVVIKIDVEGSEIEALVGGIQFLRQSDILLVLMELRPALMHKHATEVDLLFDILRSKKLQPILNHGGRFEPKGTTDWREWMGQSYTAADMFDMVWKP